MSKSSLGNLRCTDSRRKSSKSKVIFIVGPTGVGKTHFAIGLAKKIGGEIISADSMQAYKGMDILSQRPAKIEQRRVPHHLTGFLSPKEEYSAPLFSRLARQKIKAIIRRGKTPIVAGGSGLYIKALADGIFPSKGKDEKLRKRLYRLADERGAPFLYEKLKAIDRSAAEKIHPNDLKRVIRALEIYETEKKTKTSLKKETKSLRDEYEIAFFGLMMERKALYDRINKRVDSMFRNGIVKEVKGLLGHRLSITSHQALGIKEIKGFLNKTYDIDTAKELLKKNTRRFAKRQLTWFRPDKRIIWFDVGKEELR